MLLKEFIRGVFSNSKNRGFIESTEIVNRGLHTVKIRLRIKSNLFIDVFYNDKKRVISFSLILSDERIFGRNNMGPRGWHKHPLVNPKEHDFSKDGKREITILEFLDEIENILVQKKLL